MKKNTPKSIVGKANPNNINRSSLNKEVKYKCTVKERNNKEIKIMKKNIALSKALALRSTASGGHDPSEQLEFL